MTAKGDALLASSETENILVILTCIYSEPHYLIQNEKNHSTGSKSCAIILIIRVSNLHIKIPLGNIKCIVVDWRADSRSHEINDKFNHV